MQRYKRLYRLVGRKRLVADEQGMTIIELLTALVLLTMVTMLLSTFLFMGISMYKRVTATNQIRSQGDALISQVISYFKDVEYVSNGGTNQINIVKKALTAAGDEDSDKYVDAYSMSITADLRGIEVLDINKNHVPPRNLHFELPGQYRLAAGSTLSARDNYLVEVYLKYEKIPDGSTLLKDIENPVYEISTQIPLFRSE